MIAILLAVAIGMSIGTPVGYVACRKLRARRMRRSIGDLMGWMKENLEIARNMTVPGCQCRSCATQRSKNLSN